MISGGLFDVTNRASEAGGRILQVKSSLPWILGACDRHLMFRDGDGDQCQSFSHEPLGIELSGGTQQHCLLHQQHQKPIHINNIFLLSLHQNTLS